MAAEKNKSTDLSNINRKDEFTGTVVKTMLAGAVIDIGLDAPGILHISQLQKEAVNKVEDVLEVGQEVKVWVKRVFPKKNRVELTMIEPLPLEWREIKEGMIVKGTVERLEKFGAFVDIGAGRPGLVHISELAHGYIRSPEDAVNVGEEVEVKVLSVNRRRKQIKLSLKATTENPMEIAKKIKKSEPKVEEPEKPTPTAMELAMREAMEKSQDDESGSQLKNKKEKNTNDQELESILTRTMEQKVKTNS